MSDLRIPLPQKSVPFLIQNGRDAEAGRYPYVVSLKTFFTQRHICGGALVAPNVVITAAHCLDPSDPQAETRPRVNIGGLTRHDPDAEVKKMIHLLFRFSLCLLAQAEEHPYVDLTLACWRN